ncbi:MAG: hypothetical protein NC081_09520 [Roseburia sp.]|nr:hypothetical protein [Roseburia sp.]
MQIGNLDNHGRESHQVTHCISSHTEIKKEVGNMAAASSASASLKAGQTPEPEQLAMQLSPVDWLKNILSKGRGLLFHVWGDSYEDGAKQLTPQSRENIALEHPGGAGQQTGTKQLGEIHQKKDMEQKRIEQMSPYFVMSEKKEVAPGLLQRFRMRVHTVAGYLEKHLPFTQTGSFQAKQQKSKEDLRKHSRYRKDELEIDCILTDDSYLMDSYDRKGKYSKLSTENRT